MHRFVPNCVVFQVNKAGRSGSNARRAKIDTRTQSTGLTASRRSVLVLLYVLFKIFNRLSGRLERRRTVSARVCFSGRTGTARVRWSRSAIHPLSVCIPTSKRARLPRRADSPQETRGNRIHQNGFVSPALGGNNFLGYGRTRRDGATASVNQRPPHGVQYLYCSCPSTIISTALNLVR